MAARTFILASGWRVSSLERELQEYDTQTDHQFHFEYIDKKFCEGYAAHTENLVPQERNMSCKLKLQIKY